MSALAPIGAVCQRCRKILRSDGGDCACPIPILPPSTGCEGKQRYSSRLAAESGLATRRAQWRFNPSRSPQPPERIYRCPGCNAWHLTSRLA